MAATAKIIAHVSLNDDHVGLLNSHYNHNWQMAAFPHKVLTFYMVVSLSIESRCNHS